MQQAKGPAAQKKELEELAQIYVNRGLNPQLAMQARKRAHWGGVWLINSNANNKRPPTSKSMPPTGDKHAEKLKAPTSNSKRKAET